MSGSENSEVFLWDLQKQKTIYTSNEKGQEVKQVTWCPFAESTCFVNIKDKGVFAKDLRSNEVIKASIGFEVENIVESRDS